MDIHAESYPQEKSLKSKRALKKLKGVSSDVNMKRVLPKTKSKICSKDFCTQKSCVSMMRNFVFEEVLQVRETLFYSILLFSYR